MQNLGQKPTLTQDTKKKKKKARFKKLSCWYCGKNGHKMNTCTFKREASIKSRLAKLEKHFMKMKTQIKQYELQKQKMEQYFNSRAYRLKLKKKRRRHKALVQIQNKAVKIRTLLLTEDKVEDMFHFERAANIIMKLGGKEKKSVYKAYNTLFCRDLTTDMAISASGLPLDIIPPDEPNPDTYMDVEPTQEELEEEEEIWRQTENMKRERILQRNTKTDGL